MDDAREFNKRDVDFLLSELLLERAESNVKRGRRDTAVCLLRNFLRNNPPPAIYSRTGKMDPHTAKAKELLHTLIKGDEDAASALVYGADAVRIVEGAQRDVGAGLFVFLNSVYVLI